MVPELSREDESTGLFPAALTGPKGPQCAVGSVLHCSLPGFVAASSNRQVFGSGHLSSVRMFLLPGLGRLGGRERG